MCADIMQKTLIITKEENQSFATKQPTRQKDESVAQKKSVQVNAETKISSETKRLLKSLAQKYEVSSFSDGDPSCILRRYNSVVDIEVAAFICALLSFGRRDLFLQKVEHIFSLADAVGEKPSTWIKSGTWKKMFPSTSKKFYRFYSYDDMNAVFRILQMVLQEEKSFGEYVRKKYFFHLKNYTKNCTTIASKHIRSRHDDWHTKVHDVLHEDVNDELYDELRLPDRRLLLAYCISKIFAGCRAVPQSTTCANKRIHMFLRWMVRTNSPVDVGIWNWYSPSDLIIPLDTHVMAQAVSLGLICSKSTANAKTALLLSDKLKQIWHDDPCRGDFALFGLGVNGDSISVRSRKKSKGDIE